MTRIAAFLAALTVAAPVGAHGNGEAPDPEAKPTYAFSVYGSGVCFSIPPSPRTGGASVRCVYGDNLRVTTGPNGITIKGKDSR